MNFRRTIPIGAILIEQLRCAPWRRSLGTTTAKLAHRYAFGVDVDTVILGVKNRIELRECLEAEAEGALSAHLTRQIDEAVGRR